MGVVALPLYDEDVLAAVPGDHALAKRQRLTTGQLVAALPLLLLAEGHCLRDQALEACRLPPRGEHGVDVQATSLATLRHLVAAGHGCTLLPALEARGRHRGIAVRPLRDEAAHRRIALIHRTTDPRAEAYATLADLWRASVPRDVVAPC